MWFFQDLFNRFLTCTMEGYIIKHIKEIWIKINIDFKCNQINKITKICKFKTKWATALPIAWGKGEGFNFINENINPLPITAHHKHTSKLLLCYFFGENNSMRDLRGLNLVRTMHHNLRLFDAQPRIISHRIRFVCDCVCGARIMKTCVCGTGTCV